MGTATRTPTDAPADATKTPWLSLRGMDVAKAGVGLYILGMMISCIYYARCHILALELTRTQSILLGAYVVVLYLGVPAGLIWIAQGLKRRGTLRRPFKFAVIAILGLDVF